MQLISVHQGKLIKLTESVWTAARDSAVGTGLAAMDEILPAGLARGAVHELLDDEDYMPAFVAMTFATADGRQNNSWRARLPPSRLSCHANPPTDVGDVNFCPEGTMDCSHGLQPVEIPNSRFRPEGTEETSSQTTIIHNQLMSLRISADEPSTVPSGRDLSGDQPRAEARGYNPPSLRDEDFLAHESALHHPTSNLKPQTTIIWSDPARTLYPPALFQHVNPQHLFILRPRDLQEELWALAECLRCRGVGAVVARLPARLHRNDVRRLQLAAERGGGIGVFLRPRSADIYAAATRWLVEPAPGERTIHRWKLTLLHGHGGQIGKSFILERCRENNSVRAVNELADRSGAAAAQQIRFA